MSPLEYCRGTNLRLSAVGEFVPVAEYCDQNVAYIFNCIVLNPLVSRCLQFALLRVSDAYVADSEHHRLSCCTQLKIPKPTNSDAIEM